MKAVWIRLPGWNQGHPTTVFCKISVWRSKYFLEFTIIWERLKVSRWAFHLGTIFRSLSETFPTNFWSLIFLQFTPYVRLIFLGKRSLKFRIQKIINWWRGIRRILSFVKRSITTKNFPENNTEALVISKGLKFPKDDRTDTNFVVTLRIDLQRSSKSTLDSLKSVFYVFRRKPSLGVPVASCCFAYCIISIPFICSDTAIRVAKTIISAKVLPLCFFLVVYCCLMLLLFNFAPEPVPAFFHLGNRAEISHLSPGWNWSW